MKTERNEKLYEQVYEKYPLFFQKRKPLDGHYKDCIDAAWTLHIGPMEGWLPLIDKLCEDISRNIKKLPKEDYRRFEVIQIKEKMGGMRFYMHINLDGASPDIKDVAMSIEGYIRKAEGESYKICEICGEPGFLREGMWVKTLCETHAGGKGKWKSLQD